MISLTGLLIKYVKKRWPENEREAFGLLSGYTGIICNLLLCAVKFTLGALTGAVSVTADAINNLTDASVNIVTIAGTKLSLKPVDKEHPFGHGRAEYISALVVAFSVFIMSFELAKSSVLKIIHPKEVTFGAAYLIILILAVSVKLWMAYFNSRLYKITANLNLKAVMKDSLNDCIATGATIAVIVAAGKYNIYRIDGIIGLAVAVVVFFSGVFIVKDILGPLLGEPPSKELTDRIEEIILENPSVFGVHDLIVHNYGPGRIIASAHAEMPSKLDLTAAHDIIDLAERKITEELNINICIHIDPVATDDGELEKYKTLTEIIISEFNPDFTFHDFRLGERNNKKLLTFDLVIPFEYEGEKEKIEKRLKSIYLSKLPDTELDINIEHSYTE